MATVGWIVSIEGCEYAFGTAGTGGVTYTYGSDDWSPAWTILDGALNWDDPPSWSERTRSDGSFESGSVTFVLEDVIAETGSAAGQNVCTYLLTRSPNLLPSTRLTASIGASDTTIVVDDESRLGISSYPATIWVEREAIRIDSESPANTLNVAAGGRGYLGTFGISHEVNAESLYFPEVWAALPALTRRRVILWSVSDTGAVTPEWRCVCGRAPRLHATGAPMELSCEAIWTLHASTPLGADYGTTRIRGVHRAGVAVQVDADATRVMHSRVFGAPWEYPTDDTLRQACLSVKDSIAGVLASAGFASANPSLLIEGGRVVFRVDATAGLSNARVFLRVGSATASGTSTESSSTRRAEAVVENTPTVLHVSQVNYSNNVIPLTSVNRLPGAWTTVVGTAYAGARTTVTAVLRGAYDEQTDLDFYVASVATSGTHGNGTRAPYVVGAARLIPRDGEAPQITNRDPVRAYIERDVAIRVGARIVTDHWAAGLANAIDERSVLKSTVTARDWDFSTALMGDVIAATFGPHARREWVFDGSFTLGDLLKEELALSSCGLSLRSSRLAIVPIGPATAATDVAATLTEADYLEDPRWEQLTDEMITSVAADIEGTTIRVTDARGLGRYGRGQTISAKLRGRAQQIRAVSDPVNFANTLMARVIGPYSDPVGLLSLVVPAAEFLSSVFIGDYVDVTDWLAPSGDGTRGVGSASALAAFGELSTRAQVVGRAVNLADGSLTLECLLFPQVYGYAPAGRISASPTTTTVTILDKWINALGDYGNPDSSSTSGDAAYFAAGYRVRLVKMDTTSDTYESLIIQSVSPPTITFTTAISAPTRASIAGGDWWDVVFDDFTTAGIDDAQKRSAYLGSFAAGVIAGTASPVRPWAP